MVFLVNPESYDVDALFGFEVIVGGHDTLLSLAAFQDFDFGFIWGGRIEADLLTRQIFLENSIKPVFSELGWLPQRGTVYFDLCGTNSQISRSAPAPRLAFGKMVSFECKRFLTALRVYGRVPRLVTSKLGGSPLKVFVPLQDETDTNITEDSPFLTMNELVSFLASTYPHDHFHVRPHPRARPPYIRNWPNVFFQDTSDDPIHALNQYDMVLGINSTLLTEAAFLGHRVACLGRGIASIFGLASVIDPIKPPARLQDLPDVGRRVDALNYLLGEKQLSQARISDPDYVRSSYLGDILNLKNRA